MEYTFLYRIGFAELHGLSVMRRQSRPPVGSIIVWWIMS